MHAIVSIINTVAHKFFFSVLAHYKMVNFRNHYPNKPEQNVLQMRPDFLLSLLCTNDRSVVFLFLKAISLEPHLLDAYWHRHRIYLLRNDPDRALDDLNVIVENNKKHAGVCMSLLTLPDSRETRYWCNTSVCYLTSVLDKTEPIRLKGTYQTKTIMFWNKKYLMCLYRHTPMFALLSFLLCSQRSFMESKF